MKVKRTWLLAAVCWAYFITAVALYDYLHLARVNTFDFLLGVVVTLVLSAWYVTNRIRYRDRARPKKSGWVIGPYVNLRYRDEPRTPPITEPPKGE